MFGKPGMMFMGAVMLSVLSLAPAGAEAPAAAAQRQEEEKAADKRLTELNKKMEELAAEARKATGETKADMNRLYDDFKKQQAVAAKELEELRKSTNESWEKAKGNMDKALENLNGLYERTKARAKGKDKDAEK